MISCSTLEMSLELRSSAFKSFSIEMAVLQKITDITYERAGVWTLDYFHLILDPKCFSMMSFSTLKTSLELCSSTLKSFYSTNSRFLKK